MQRQYISRRPIDYAREYVDSKTGLKWKIETKDFKHYLLLWGSNESYSDHSLEQIRIDFLGKGIEVSDSEIDINNNNYLIKITNQDKLDSFTQKQKEQEKQEQEKQEQEKKEQEKKEQEKKEQEKQEQEKKKQEKKEQELIQKALAQYAKNVFLGRTAKTNDNLPIMTDNEAKLMASFEELHLLLVKNKSLRTKWKPRTEELIELIWSNENTKEKESKIHAYYNACHNDLEILQPNQRQCFFKVLSAIAAIAIGVVVGFAVGGPIGSAFGFSAGAWLGAAILGTGASAFAGFMFFRQDKKEHHLLENVRNLALEKLQ